MVVFECLRREVDEFTDGRLHEEQGKPAERRGSRLDWSAVIWKGYQAVDFELSRLAKGVGISSRS